MNMAKKDIKRNKLQKLTSIIKKSILKIVPKSTKNP